MTVEVVALFLVSPPLLLWSLVRLEAWHRRRSVADYVVRLGAGQIIARQLEDSFFFGFTASAEQPEAGTLTFEKLEEDLAAAGVRRRMSFDPFPRLGRSISGSIPVDWEPGSAQRILERLGPSWPSRDRSRRGRVGAVRVTKP